MMMSDEDGRIMWRCTVVMIRVLRGARGKAKFTGEGIYITLSVQILREEGRKTFSTNIVSYFAATVR